MYITKTNFIQYLHCPKSLWLLKNDPDNYPHGEVSVFMKKLIREGYEVERYVQEFFESNGKFEVSFQTEFKTEGGHLYARADAFEIMIDGTTALYEIKSSTSIKTDSKHNHIKDACFQKICAERAGQRIDRVFLVHLNGEYVRDGEINTEELLVFNDITERVAEIEPETNEEINTALQFLASDQDLQGCSCREKSRGNHCDTFTIFNPDVPKSSIYHLPNVSQKKIGELLSTGVVGLDAVPDDYTLSDRQQLVVKAAKIGTPQINKAAIRQFLSNLEFPLYFFDYETFSSAVPLLDGTGPHQQLPVQYSVHILEEDGTLSHKEYLEREARLPDRLVKQIVNDIGPSGSIVSWHASFEKWLNREMGERYTENAAFLNSINDRMVDLENVFKVGYVDARFNGSTSIKNVLPVVCPDLDYEELNIQDGATAMDAWGQMINASQKESDEIATDLLKYCRLDTYAMVEITRFLSRQVNFAAV